MQHIGFKHLPDGAGPLSQRHGNILGLDLLSACLDQQVAQAVFIYFLHSINSFLIIGWSICSSSKTASLLRHFPIIRRFSLDRPEVLWYD